MKTFVDKLIEAIRAKKSILCVGLDPQIRYIPEYILDEGKDKAEGSLFEGVARAIVKFNKEIIKAVAPFATIVKPQMAFYEAYGHWGVWAFEKTVKFAKGQGLLVLEDAKRGDGGDTAEAYAKGHLGKVTLWSVGQTCHIRGYGVDAMTINPWIGTSCLSPFLEVAQEFGKGIFVVDKTSFKPNSEIEQLVTTSGRKVWEETAKLVREKWSRYSEGKTGYSNVGVVMGATYPEDAVTMREILPASFFLVPGYGAQGGGGAEGVIRGIRDDGLGVIVNSSRGINYAYLRDRFPNEPEDFAESAGKAAEFARNDLNAALKRVEKLPW